MVNNIITLLTSTIISVISSTGYLGIFLLMGAESALIPIPSEITMTFAGYLASVGKFNLFAVIFVGAFANLVGSWLAYWLGYWGERTIVLNVIKKYGKYILISEHEFEKSEEWYRKYGEAITFFSRILPVIRTFISLPAGIAKMNFWRFTLFTFVGSLIWSGLLAYIGFALGKNWNSLHPYYQKFEFVIVGAAILLAGYYLYHKVVKLLHKK